MVSKSGEQVVGRLSERRRSGGVVCSISVAPVEIVDASSVQLGCSLAKWSGLVGVATGEFGGGRLGFMNGFMVFGVKDLVKLRFVWFTPEWW